MVNVNWALKVNIFRTLPLYSILTRLSRRQLLAHRDKLHKRLCYLRKRPYLNRILSRITAGSGCGVLAVPFFSSKSSQVEMSDDIGECLKQADQFYNENKFQEVYDTLVKHKAQTANCELQWKLARAARDLSQLSATSKEKVKELIFEGLECAENAVKAGDSDFAAHKWKGILLSDVSEFEGSKKQIANAYLIRDEFTRASELNPKDALCYSLLGEWCYTVSNMGWIQKNAAKALFGTPPSSSFQEALEQFLKAEEVSSGFYVGNQVSLGKTYIKLGNKAEARKWLEKAVQYPRETEKDDKSIEEAKKLLKTL